MMVLPIYFHLHIENNSPNPYYATWLRGCRDHKLVWSEETQKTIDQNEGGCSMKWYRDSLIGKIMVPVLLVMLIGFGLIAILNRVWLYDLGWEGISEEGRRRH